MEADGEAEERARPEKLLLLQTLTGSLDRQIAWILAADTKAIFLVTLAAVMMTLQATVPLSQDDWWFTVLRALSLTSSLVGLVLSFWVLFPRLSGPTMRLLYFNRFGAMEYDAFEIAVVETSQEDWLRDFIRQCHRNGQIARTKFLLLRWALSATGVALVPWILILLVSFGRSVLLNSR
jgi:hypothetical protein